MINYLITLSALTAAVILLRGLFRKRISQRIIYAMWLLVVLRICLPFTVFHYDLPEKAILSPPTQETTAVIETKVPDSEVTTKENIIPEQPAIKETVATQAIISTSPTAPPNPAETEVSNIVFITEDAERVDISRILFAIWITGSTLLFIWYAVSYIIFTFKLRCGRIFHSKYGVLKVYISQSAASPCLCGIIPAIYISENAAGSSDLNHILAHEHTHFRHGDNIWSLIRIIACTAFWWNPLIWTAAILSKVDAELACDESVTLSLSADDRLSYANAIINSIPKKKSFASGFVSGSVKERIVMLKARKKNSILLTVVAFSLALICIGCSYTGPTEEATSDGTDTKAPAGKITYADILEQYKNIADGYNDGSILKSEDELDYKRNIPLCCDKDDDYAYDWSNMLVDNISPYWSGNVIDFGYSFYDINKDSVNELIWLRCDKNPDDSWATEYKVLAIFTQVNEEAKYIDSYYQKYSAVIVENGIFTRSSGGAAYTTCTLSQLKENSNELLTKLEFGQDGYRDSKNDIPNYYKKNGKETIEISKEEFDQYYEKYSGKPLMMSPEQLEDLGMNYISLYSSENRIDPTQLFDENSIAVLENDTYGYKNLIYAFLSKDIVTCADYAGVPTAMIEDLNTVEFGKCSFRKVLKDDGNDYYLFEFKVIKSNLDSLPVGDYTYSLGTKTNLHFSNENLPKFSYDNYILDNFISLLANYCMPEIEGDEQYSKNNYLNGICTTAMKMKCLAYPDSVPITKDLSKQIVYDLFGIDDFKIPSEVGHFKDGIFNFKNGWQYPTNVIFELSDVTHESGKYTIDVQFYADMLRLVPSHKVRYEIVEADNIFGYRLVNVSFISRSNYDRGFAPSV